jgi:hypothetical protein
MASNSKNPVTAVDMNRNYFKALSATRASLDRLALMMVVLIVCLGISNLGPLGWFAEVPGGEIFSLLSNLNTVIMVVCGAVLLVSALRSVTYRYQVLFSAVMAAAALGWVYSLCLLALPLATFSKALGKSASANLFVVGGIAAVVLVAGSLVVHLVLLRRRLRLGHSEKRTIGNFVAVSGSNRAKIIWITLAAVAVVPNVLTSGQYLVNFFGVLMLIACACVIPSLPVEFAYLAYLKSIDRAYWETRPRSMPNARRRRLTRKARR